MYVLQIDRLERLVLAERQVAVIAATAGVRDVQVPSVTEALAEFEAYLIAEPTQVDPQRTDLLIALGVGRGG